MRAQVCYKIFHDVKEVIGWRNGEFKDSGNDMLLIADLGANFDRKNKLFLVVDQTRTAMQVFDEFSGFAEMWKSMHWLHDKVKTCSE